MPLPIKALAREGLSENPTADGGRLVEQHRACRCPAADESFCQGRARIRQSGAEGVAVTIAVWLRAKLSLFSHIRWRIFRALATTLSRRQTKGQLSLPPATERQRFFSPLAAELLTLATPKPAPTKPTYHENKTYLKNCNARHRS